MDFSPSEEELLNEFLEGGFGTEQPRHLKIKNLWICQSAKRLWGEPVQAGGVCYFRGVKKGGPVICRAALPRSWERGYEGIHVLGNAATRESTSVTVTRRAQTLDVT